MRWMMTSLVLAVLFMAGCTSEGKTVNTLRSAGYTDIKAGGYDFWECGDDDTYATKFTARNPNGQMVHGTVCCGLVGKGCTIRF
jgi:hypothetical protein